MSSFWWGQSALDELIEKATSELLPAGQVDLALHLEISDQIRSKKVSPKDAVKSLKSRLSHKNPNVILATLSLVDTCVKNSGSAFVKEVATRDFMEEITHLIKVPTGCNQDVKQKVLYLIQVWGIASKGNPSLSYISGTYNLLRAEGYVFPPITEKIDSILLETAVAPEWTDSDCCERCRTSFTLTNRKHHCRQCGSTFCQQCSSKSIPLPHLGINDTVRVCDGCYIKVKLAKVADKDTVPQLLGTPASISSSLTPTYTPSIKNRTAAETITTTAATTATTAVNDDQFESDLKKALEISLKESEQQKRISSFYTVKKEERKSPEEEEEEANLAAAIAASLKDVNPSSSYPSSTTTRHNNNELSTIEMENIQLFSTLMQRVNSAGGDISSDLQIKNLYDQIGALQPKLVKALDEASYKHGTFVQLHEKLSRAVKAYDKLLEDRISGSSYRAHGERDLNSNNYNTGYASFNGFYNGTPQQQQQHITPASVPQNYNGYNPPQTTPFPQTPVSQQSYVYPQNHIQQQQPQPTPVVQHQQTVQQTPVVQHQSYTPLASASVASSNITSTQHQYAQHQYHQTQQVQTSHTPLSPSATDGYQQKAPGMNNQLYSYPSVPNTIPSHNGNHYYSSSDTQQIHVNPLYDNAIQQSNSSKHQPVEEAPLIEL